MFEEGMLSREEVRDLLAEPIELELGLLTGKSARHFVAEALSSRPRRAFLPRFAFTGGNRSVCPATPCCLAGGFGCGGCGH